MKYSAILLFACIGLLMVGSLHAQDRQNTNGETETIIRFDLEALKADSSSDFMDTPTKIMDTMVKHDALNASDIRYIDKAYRVNAQFIFPSMQDFREWYDSDKAKKLLNTFKKDFDELELGFQIIR